MKRNIVQLPRKNVTNVIRASFQREKCNHSLHNIDCWLPQPRWNISIWLKICWLVSINHWESSYALPSKCPFQNEATFYVLMFVITVERSLPNFVLGHACSPISWMCECMMEGDVASSWTRQERAGAAVEAWPRALVTRGSRAATTGSRTGSGTWTELVNKISRCDGKRE